MCCTGFSISKWHTWNYEVWWKIHCIKHLLFPCFVYAYTVSVVILQCGYNISSCISVGWPIQAVCDFYIFDHTGSRVSNWIFHSQSTVLCVNWSNNWWWRRDGKVIFRVMFACGRTSYHSFRVQLLSDLHIPNTKWSFNVCISCSMLSSQIRLGGTSWHMKPVPVILLFSSSRDSLSNMCNFDLNTFLVRKLDDFMKAYIISVSPPVLNTFL